MKTFRQFIESSKHDDPAYMEKLYRHLFPDLPGEAIKRQIFQIANEEATAILNGENTLDALNYSFVPRTITFILERLAQLKQQQSVNYP